MRSKAQVSLLSLNSLLQRRFLSSKCWLALRATLDMMDFLKKNFGTLGKCKVFCTAHLLIPRNPAAYAAAKHRWIRGSDVSLAFNAVPVSLIVPPPAFQDGCQPPRECECNSLLCQIMKRTSKVECNDAWRRSENCVNFQDKRMSTTPS